MPTKRSPAPLGPGRRDAHPGEIAEVVRPAGVVGIGAQIDLGRGDRVARGPVGLGVAGEVAVVVAQGRVGPQQAAAADGEPEPDQGEQAADDQQDDASSAHRPRTRRLRGHGIRLDPCPGPASTAGARCDGAGSPHPPPPRPRWRPGRRSGSIVPHRRPRRRRIPCPRRTDRSPAASRPTPPRRPSSPRPSPCATPRRATCTWSPWSGPAHTSLAGPFSYYSDPPGRARGPGRRVARGAGGADARAPCPWCSTAIRRGPSAGGPPRTGST